MTAQISLLCSTNQPDRQPLIENALQNDSGLNILGFVTLEDAVHVCAELHPDILLVDINNPDAKDLWLISYLCKRYPRLKIVVIFEVANAEWVQELLQVGVVGFLTRPTRLVDLPLSIHAVHSGKVVIDPLVASILLQNIDPDHS